MPLHRARGLASRSTAYPQIQGPFFVSTGPECLRGTQCDPRSAPPQSDGGGTGRHTVGGQDYE
jgi:hypothetical protein